MGATEMSAIVGVRRSVSRRTWARRVSVRSRVCSHTEVQFTYRLDVLQLGYVLCRDGTVPEDVVDLLLRLAVRLRVLQEVVKRKRQSAARRFVARNEERDCELHLSAL